MLVAQVMQFAMMCLSVGVGATRLGRPRLCRLRGDGDVVCVNRDAVGFRETATARNELDDYGFADLGCPARERFVAYYNNDVARVVGAGGAGVEDGWCSHDFAFRFGGTLYIHNNRYF